MNKLAEKALDLAARLLVGILDRVDRRRERPARPALDYRLETLSIDEAVEKARADLEAHRKRRDENH